MADFLSFAEFQQTDLRVATILAAERIEGSDKLLKLQVDLGEEKRQIVAGIGRAYDPDFLVGKQIVVIANLEPRSLMGEESQGMLLAANDETPVFLQPEREVKPGAKIQ